MPTQEEASEYFLKNKQEQLGYLIASTLRIEKGLATLTQNQESLERIMEQKFYDLDVKVTEIQSVVEQLQDDMQERKGKTTTDAFARVPRAQRSAAVPVIECCFCSLLLWWLNFVCFCLLEILYVLVKYLFDHVFDHMLP